MKKMIKHGGLLWLLLFQFSHTIMAQAAHLEIRYPQSLADDTLELYRLPAMMPIQNHEGNSSGMLIATRQARGLYRFKIDLDRSPTLIYIQLRRNIIADEQLSKYYKQPSVNAEVLPYYVVSADDQVTIDLSETPKMAYGRTYNHNFKVRFQGAGALKYTLHKALDSITYHSPFDEFPLEPQYIDTNHSAKAIRKSVTLLENYRKQLDADDYQTLRTYAIYHNKNREVISAASKLKKRVQAWSTVEKEAYITAWQEHFRPERYDIKPDFLLQSHEFAQAEMNKVKFFSAVRHGEHYKDGLFFELSRDLSGKLREKMLVYYLQTALVSFDGDPGLIFKKAGQMISSAEYRPLFDQVVKRTAGQPAFDFELTDVNGKKVKLSDFKGKNVFIDFWYTGCGSCVNYYQNILSKIEHTYEGDPDMVFISISIDKDRSAWLKSVLSNKYTSPRIINLYTNGEGSRNEVIERYQISAYPQPLLIGKDQKIKVFSNTLMSASGILKAIGELK